MIVAVVDVRIMGRRVPVRMRMRLAGVPREIVMVVVMGVVAMLVRVFAHRMLMLVLVPLAQVQPNPRAHQN